jgi:hypothetical protein
LSDFNGRQKWKNEKKLYILNHKLKMTTKQKTGQDSWENDPNDIKAFEESLRLDKQRIENEKKKELERKLEKQKQMDDRKAKLQLQKELMMQQQQQNQRYIPEEGEEEELGDEMQNILMENALLNKPKKEGT